MGPAAQVVTATKPPIPVLPRPLNIKPHESEHTSYQVTLIPITEFESLVRLVNNIIIFISLLKKVFVKTKDIMKLFSKQTTLFYN